jgi:hypothetical protein
MSVASSLSKNAKGHKDGLAHRFFGSICDPTPLIGLRLVMSNMPANFTAAKVVACTIMPSGP